MDWVLHISAQFKFNKIHSNRMCKIAKHARKVCNLHGDIANMMSEKFKPLIALDTHFNFLLV